MIPPSPDQVVAGDMQRTRLKDIKALIFVGQMMPGCREIFSGPPFVGKRPGQISQGKDPVSARRQRENLRTEILFISESTNLRRNWIFFTAKCLRTEKVWRPSYLIQEIRKLYPDLVVTDEETVDCRAGVAKAWHERWIREIQDVRNGVLNMDGWMELYRRYRKDPAVQKK